MKRKYLFILIQAAVLAAVAAISVASVAHAKNKRTGEMKCPQCQKMAEAFYTENCKGDDSSTACQNAKYKMDHEGRARQAK